MSKNISLKSHYFNYDASCFTNGHEDDCQCFVCFRLSYIFGELKKIKYEANPTEQSKASTCRMFNGDTQEEDENPNELEIKDSSEEHGLLCDCLSCATVELVSDQINRECMISNFELDDLDNGEDSTAEDNRDNSSQPEIFVICESERPVVLTVRDGEVQAGFTANTEDEKPFFTLAPVKRKKKEKGKSKETKQEDVSKKNVQKCVKLRSISFDDMVDTCVCPPGKLSSICLKHSIAYSQHAAVQLTAEGCTCTETKECAYCERMNCMECQHEADEMKLCPFDTPDNDDIMADVNRWLDEEFRRAGLEESHCGPVKDGPLLSEEELVDKLTSSLKRNVLDTWDWDMCPVAEPFELTEEMKEEILNVDELFDVRMWPRCYNLKGKKDSEGKFVSLEEELSDTLLDLWKNPTQMVEDMLPVHLGRVTRDEELEAEAEMKQRLAERLKKTARPPPRGRTVGLTPDWDPVVEPFVNNNSQPWTRQEKIDKCAELMRQVDEQCKEKWLPEREIGCFEKVQQILDRYGEERSPVGAEKSHEERLDGFIDKEYAAMKERLEGSGATDIGYKEEFWQGLEQWRPDVGESDLHRKLVDEMVGFKSEVQQRFQQLKMGTSKQEADPDGWLDSFIQLLPKQKDKLMEIKNKIPKEWLTEKGLKEVEKVMLGVGEVTASEAKEGEEEFTYESAEEADEEADDLVEMEASAEANECRYDMDEEGEDEGAARLPEATRRLWAAEGLAAEPTRDPGVAQAIKEELKSASGCALRSPHEPVPYCIEMKEKLLEKNPGELHPIQEMWRDKPMFPFWTPSVVYDFNEVEKVIFGDNDAASVESDYDENVVNDLESKLKAERTEYEDRDEEEETEEDAIESEEEEEEEEETIEEDNISESIQLKNKVVITTPHRKGDNVLVGGVLTLDEIKRGIAGRVMTSSEWALELDSEVEVNLHQAVPHPAQTWPFSLDTFQKQAIIALEAGLNVFVLAHTSAGKTVTAEYTIGMAERNGSKVIYTSPIKALSNQKFKDFKDDFKGRVSVGIITGDVQLNEDAQCLIMTTEILRSMLYNNSSQLQDLEFVIFDEVHYFNDPERGNVWEEVLILLPKDCKIVMLSATVPNPMQFASWVGCLKKRVVAVTKTRFRPVPLKHYMHVGFTPKTVKWAYELKIAEGLFNEANFDDAVEKKNEIFKNMAGRMNDRKKWSLFVQKHLKELDRLPTVVFSFSRRKCDLLASYLSKVTLTLESDKLAIKSIINKHLLKLEDKNISQIIRMKKLLIRGIGVHHSGILPIMKEIVELLFQSGKVKLLFATETFAMGVNMPAKTVVFESVKKFDGVDMRPLKAAEYIQMAGRAGRRNKDKSGTVIVLNWVKEKSFAAVQKNELMRMMTGRVETLTSQFRLRYSMILNTIQSSGDITIDGIMSDSFFEHTSRSGFSKLILDINKFKDKKIELEAELYEDPDDVKKIFKTYYDLCYEYYYEFRKIREMMLSQKMFSNHLKAGKFVLVSQNMLHFIVGAIIEVEEYPHQQKSTVYWVAVLTQTAINIPSPKQKWSEVREDEEELWCFMVGYWNMLSYNLQRQRDDLVLLKLSAYHIIGLVTNMSIQLSNDLVQVLKSSRALWSRNKGLVDDFSRRLWDMVNSVRPRFLEEDHIAYRKNQGVVAVVFSLKDQLDHFINNCLVRNFSLPQFMRYFCWKSVTNGLKRLEQEKMAQTMILAKNYEKKLQLLQQRGFIASDKLLEKKGRIASRLSNYEVFVTELLMENILLKLDQYETAALLSCLVCQDKISRSKDRERHNSDAPSDVAPFTRGHKNQKHLLKTAKKQELTEDDVLLNTLSSLLKPNDRGTSFQKISLMSRETHEMILAATSGMLNEEEEEEKSDDEEEEILTLSDNLKEAIKEVEKLKEEITDQESLLSIEDTDMAKIGFQMVPIMYLWAKGMTFEKIMSLLDDNVQEGILMRWIMHLIETIKDIQSAARQIEDDTTQTKLRDAGDSLKRGIIMLPSIYHE